MQGSPFTPRTYQPEPVHTPIQHHQQPIQAPTPTSKKNAPDKIGEMMLKFQQNLIVGLVFLLPLFFIPGLPASLGFDKVILSLTIGLFVLISLGLSSLRYSKVSTVMPYALAAFWGFVGVSFLSGFLSGDIQDALRGSFFEPQTAGFFAVMGLLMTIPLVLQRSKAMTLKALIALGASSGVAMLYTLARLGLGDGSLALKSFGSVTTSPVGSYNDMAILAGLTVVVVLITLLQLPLKKSFQIGLAVLSVFSLAVMAAVNFFDLWVVIGFFGLLLLIFIFSRDTLFSRTEEEGSAVPAVSPIVIGVTMMVCVVSILFVIAGDYLGARITSLTGVNYLEVRPSVTATIDIARGVYHDDMLLGIGPNKFIDAWRLHKDRSINETIFWNTNFNAGFGFIPTIFITLGVLGGLAILAFQVMYVYLGYRTLMRGEVADSYWYYFGVVTFIGSLFLWGMSYVYVSGPVILLLAALLTGLSFTAYQALVPGATKSVPLVSTRRRGFFLMTVVIVIITASVGTLFTVGKQYVAQAQFTKARSVAKTPEEFDQMTQAAYNQYKDDVFAGAIAQARLLELRNMLSIKNPTKDDQAKFITLARQSVEAGEISVNLDPTSPDGHATLANILIVLSGVGFQDAENRANGKLEDARWRDPLNPSYDMMAAYMSVQLGDTKQAREQIKKALALKNNFSEALFLQSQLDVKDGNIQSAIDTTRQIITLEPNNPTRFYQLGVLLAANKDTNGAIEAYEAAIQRDTNYANARYMLALSYIDVKRLDDALKQLKIVQDSNKDNEQLNNLIKQLETNGLPLPTQGLEGAVNEATPNQGNGQNVTSPSDPNTNLVTPVNTVNSGNTQEAPKTTPAPAPATTQPKTQ
jgi:tetratricopeptide (TPR) repeat protein